MGRIFTAIGAFFGVLFSGDKAERVRQALSSEVAALPEPKPSPDAVAKPDVVHTPAPAPVPKKPAQSEAITLLATLQREARLVDFLKEDLSAYSDEQVGAAVREIHRNSGSVVDRLFHVRPILAESEGATVDVPVGFDAARFRLTGKLTGSAPFRGQLCHHGWEVTKCELPEFTGSDLAANTISPAEVEIR